MVGAGTAKCRESRSPADSVGTVMTDDAGCFEALLGRTAKAVVVAGSAYDPRRRKNNEVLASEDRQEGLEALRVALRTGSTGNAMTG